MQSTSLVWFGTLYGPPPSCVLYYRELGLNPEMVKSFLEDVEETTSKDFSLADVFEILP